MQYDNISTSNVPNWSKYLLTINNPIEKGFSHEKIRYILDSLNLDYYAYCDERGTKTETFHTHIFLYKKSKIRFQTLKNKFPPAHIDLCNGTTFECRDYLRKEGKYKDTKKADGNLIDTFYESCPCPDTRKGQGQRTDLLDLYEWIKDGLNDYEILEKDPRYMLRLEDINKTRQTIRFAKYSVENREVNVIYQFGKTGTGKSYSIIQCFDIHNIYRVTDYTHPFDSYNGESVIVFEEFYSNNIKINDLLNLLDIYPITLPCRYSNKIACYTTVFINSNVSLEQQYTKVQKEHPETWKALLRRIDKIRYFKDIGEVEEYNSYWDYKTKTEDEWVDMTYIPPFMFR